MVIEKERMANTQTILRGAEPVKSFETYFDLLRAETPETLREVFRLRYRIYCLERRFENPADHPNGQETDRFDRRSLHSLLVYQRTGAMTGTVRLVLPEPGGAADHIPRSPGTVRLIMPIDGADPALPIQEVCSDLAAWPQDLLPAATTGEISRFAVSKDFRKRIGESQLAIADAHVSERRAEMAGGASQVMAHITLGLMRGILKMSIDRGITHWVAVMEPSLLRLLGRLGIHFTAIGSEVDHHGRRQPCYAAAVDLLTRIRVECPDVWNVITEHGRLFDRMAEISLQKPFVGAVQRCI